MLLVLLHTFREVYLHEMLCHQSCIEMQCVCRSSGGKPGLIFFSALGLNNAIIVLLIWKY